VASVHPSNAASANSNHLERLTITIRDACKLSGYGPVTIWKLIKTKRVKVVRVPGVRRTLIDFPSFKELLSSEQSDSPQPRRRGRPAKARHTRKAEPSTVSVYYEHQYIGCVLAHGHDEFEALDDNNQTLGVFKTEDDAATAIWRTVLLGIGNRYAAKMRG
jgi:hypothetical protein